MNMPVLSVMVLGLRPSLSRLTLWKCVNSGLTPVLVVVVLVLRRAAEA